MRPVESVCLQGLLYVCTIKTYFYIFLSHRYGFSNVDTTFEGTPEDMTVVDAVALRRQVSDISCFDYCGSCF